MPLPLHPHFLELLTAPERRAACGRVAGGGRVGLLRSFGRAVDAVAPSDDWTPMDLLRAYATAPPSPNTHRARVQASKHAQGQLAARPRDAAEAKPLD